MIHGSDHITFSFKKESSVLDLSILFYESKTWSSMTSDSRNIILKFVTWRFKRLSCRMQQWYQRTLKPILSYGTVHNQSACTLPPERNLRNQATILVKCLRKGKSLTLWVKWDEKLILCVQIPWMQHKFKVYGNVWRQSYTLFLLSAELVSAPASYPTDALS